MSIDALRAAEAYAGVARTAALGPETAGYVGKAEFGDLLAAALQETTSSIKAGEAAAASVATGEASLVDVVTAISAAEVSLEAAIAVRNRVIEAYQEIMRMPI